MSEITVQVSAKIIKITEQGGSADVEVGLSFDGKPAGTYCVRVNRTGKEAEQIALDEAKANFKMPEAAARKTSSSTKTTNPAEAE